MNMRKIIIAADLLQRVRSRCKKKHNAAAWLIACLFLTIEAVAFLNGATAASLHTAFEKSNFIRMTTSAEISIFLDDISSRYKTSKKQILGKSAQGRPMEALFLSKEMVHLFSIPPSPTRLTVMIIGSQHGTEPSGAEAILILARDIVDGPLQSVLNSMNLILIPNGNPDGRDNYRRVNGNEVNLSTNFIALSEPETRAINDVLIRWRPSVILDVHESAIFKRKSLALQGYMTNFEAQFETANNPNIDREILDYSREILLSEIIARVEARGLPARHYIGEITSIHQPIQHGGLSIRNLRNKAGISGAFSFLLENRLDPPFGDFKTPRNIRVRVDKQYCCITAFLDVCSRHQAEILRRSKAAHQKWRETRSENLAHLYSSYACDPARPKISLTLLRLDTGKPTDLSFDYYGRITNRHSLEMPAAYLITAHTDEMIRLFGFHHIEYEIITTPTKFAEGVERIETAVKNSIRSKQSGCVLADTGSLLIRLRQPAGRLIPLLLEPLSNSSIFLDPAYSAFIETGKNFFLYRLRDLGPFEKRR